MPEGEASPKSDAERSREFFAAIQDENGVDLSLIRANLLRPALERLRRGDRARVSAARLRELSRRSRERREKPA